MERARAGYSVRLAWLVMSPRSSDSSTAGRIHLVEIFNVRLMRTTFVRRASVRGSSPIDILKCA